jgi:hypothetical protein
VIYRIPIGLYNYNDAKTTIFAENLFYNLLYVNLSIGTPAQVIPFQLNMNSQAFYISNNFFSSNLSSTYELLSNKEIEYSYEQGTYGYRSKDIIKIKNNKTKIDFIYGTKNQKDNNLSNIGLMIPNKIQEGVYPFFISLKKIGIITSYAWTIKYFSNINFLDNIYKNENKIIGEFIIGDEPHNYESNKTIYNENEYIKVKPLAYRDSIYWDIYFDSIYFVLKGNEKNDSSKINIPGTGLSEINLDVTFIVAPIYYFRTIKEYFFDKYKKICTEKFMPDNIFRYIECDNSDSFNISSFPDIFFEHKEFETIFNLTYEDLFKLDEDKNKYIFLIFNNRITNDWVFGNLFLRKYQFVFNTDSKTIGYYKSMNYAYDNKINNNDNDKHNDKHNEIIKYIFIGILILISSILLVLIGMYIQKKYCNDKKKAKANELEDDESFNYDDNKNKTNQEIFLSEKDNTKKDMISINE